jgi:hypothetical protein
MFDSIASNIRRQAIKFENSLISQAETADSDDIVTERNSSVAAPLPLN